MKQGGDIDNLDFNSLRNQGYFDQAGAYGAASAGFMGGNMPMGGGFNFNDLMGGNSLAMQANMQANMQGMQGFGGLESMLPPRNDQNYYQEYCRLFIANVVLTTQMKELIAEKNELANRLNELENSDRGNKGGSTKSPEPLDKKSRIRRKAADVERHYKCPCSNCHKSYGSEGSLIQHVKLKHPDITEDPDWKIKILKLEGSDTEA